MRYVHVFQVQALAKGEKVMIQTADNVLDTKRRIEYGIHQILLEVGALVTSQGKEFNQTVNQRFDEIEHSIVDSQTGALNNLSSKIEHEIAQVWRQIGIMYQQVTASNTALDKLQVSFTKNVLFRQINLSNFMKKHEIKLNSLLNSQI